MAGTVPGAGGGTVVAAPAGGRDRLKTGIIAAVAVLAVLVMVLAMTFIPPTRMWMARTFGFADGGAASSAESSASSGSAKTGSSGSDDSLTVEVCEKAPKIDLRSFDTEGSNLVVKVRITQSCGSKSSLRLDDDATRITLTDADGAVFADALFDFSGDPVTAKSGSSANATIVYLPSQYWFVPSETSSGSGARTISVSCKLGQESSGSADSSGSSGSSSGSSGSDSDGLSGSDSSDEQEREDAAKAAIERQIAHDKPRASTFLTTFTNQLSSKNYGMYAEGHTWNYQQIWQQYLELKLKHPKILLVWSGDWPTYQKTGTTMYYVMLSGEAFSNESDAWNWCDAQGYEFKDCIVVDLS
ncbi:hypothetical protein [Bifidobacterium platyrrhinorum]|nr:hypothetical protein [Bifidobacterium platyrrhinorum]